ncbi:MAG: alpha/beta fold hydrolase, partial [Aeromicrobium sp.]
AYENAEYALDALAVMDATSTETAILAGLSSGATWAVHVAARAPDRVLGIFAVAPSCGFSVAHRQREQFAWHETYPQTAGWATYNKDFWLTGDLTAFREFFFSEVFNEPHSTKQIEDALDWSSKVVPETLVATTAARLGCDGAMCEPLEPLCAGVRCPVHVVHGTDDRIQPHAMGERLAELTRGSLTLIEGGGHGLNSRDPIFLNNLLREFVDRLCPPPPTRRTWHRAARRPRRALYLSSPIGLGHAQRDIAIAQELRLLQPDLQIDWLAQHPVTPVLEAHGERVHPASSWLASESAHIESESGEHDLHAFEAIRRMDSILVNNFMVFHELTTSEHYDLVIGDEAWDVDYFLHENPELKRFPFAWMTDFVGWLPMPDGGLREAALTADYNAEMIGQRERFGSIRNASLFVGNPEDVVDQSFGPGLPGIREWTEDNFEFTGYVTGFHPPDPVARAALRKTLGYRPEHKLCVVTVGGSGVGSSLLQRVLDAAPIARRLLPELRFLVVCGPRIDPGALPRRRGVLVRGYVPRLHEHLAACDIGVVQGGLTTCMELTASGTPFIYVPLEHHFEQNFHVRHRLERYDAG